MRRTAGLVVALAAALLGVTPAATAATPAGQIQLVGGTLTYTAYAGIANNVDVSPDGLGGVEIIDQAGPIDIEDADCVPTPDPPYRVDEITCDLAGVTGLRLDGGDLGDVLYVRDPMSAVLLGGTGDDKLDGGPGADQLYGGTGDDVLFGGIGNDLLVGGTGADELRGGSGIDTVSYAYASGDITADADGQLGDDGAPGEGDSIGLDVENLIGSAGLDVLGGNGSANTIHGGAGADRLTGGMGADVLYGEAGFDLIDGGIGPSTAVDVCSPGTDGAQLLNCESIRR